MLKNLNPPWLTIRGAIATRRRESGSRGAGCAGRAVLVQALVTSSFDSLGSRGHPAWCLCDCGQGVCPVDSLCRTSRSCESAMSLQEREKSRAFHPCRLGPSVTVTVTVTASEASPTPLPKPAPRPPGPGPGLCAGQPQLLKRYLNNLHGKGHAGTSCWNLLPVSRRGPSSRLLDFRAPGCADPTRPEGAAARGDF